MGRVENNVINVGEEGYCSSGEALEDLRGNKVYT